MGVQPARRGGRGALGAAPTAIPGVVFQGAADGRLFAVAAADGKQLWEFNTAQAFDTVNKVPAHGGAINTSGAVVVDGMVYVGSGYAIRAARQAATCCSPSASSSGANILPPPRRRDATKNGKGHEGAEGLTKTEGHEIDRERFSRLLPASAISRRREATPRAARQEQRPAFGVD